MANQINSRIINKHDTEVNWNKAENFIPLLGEIIIYDIDENYDYERFKIGDGKTIARLLPFVAKGATKTVSSKIISVSDSSSKPFKGLKLFGNTTQDGTPTPDAPIDLVNTGNNGTIGISVYGKNLLTYPYKETTKIMYGVNYIVNEDGTINIDGTSSSYSTFILNENISLIGGVRYKLKSGTNNISNIIQYIDGTGKIEYASVVDWKNEYQLKNIYLQVNPNKTVSELVKPMLIVDVKEEVNYEVPKGIQSLTIPTPNGLPGIQVSSGGNYTDENGQQWVCDEIDLARGVYIQRVKLFELAIADMNNSENYPGWASVQDILKCVPNATNGIINKDMYLNIGKKVSANTVNTKCVVWLDMSVYSMTQREWQEKYPDLVVKFMIPLIEPEETQLDAETIAAYRTLHTNEPYTTIYNNDNVSMETTYYLNNDIGDMCLSIYDSNGDGIVNAADYASSATKAIQDANGNVITSTYATISTVDGKAPTSHASTATTYGAASASNYGHAKASGTTPKANGTAAVGSETSSFARGDHVHPLQTSVSGSAGSLATTRYIDGVSFNGSANVTRYATCSTAATTVAKTASITEGTFSLVTGARVTVKFTYANSVANPTLNIGSTGAKAIYWHGAALASSQYWQAGAVLDFVYNGTQWDLIGIAKDNNNTYSVMTAATSSAAGTSGLVPVPAAGKQSSFLRGDGTWVVPADTKNTAGSTDTSSKIFLIGATSQAANPQTYSHDTVFVDTAGKLNATLVGAVTHSLINPSSKTYYYPMMATTATSATSTPSVNDGIAYYVLNGTTSAEGIAEFGVGNSIAKGTAGNKTGSIYLYGSGTGWTSIKTANASNNSYEITLPAKSGTFALTDGTGASGDWSINALTSSTWKTARTLTIGNKGQNVNGGDNVSWSLHDILYGGQVGTATSWDITSPGAYYVGSSAVFTGSGNPENANEGTSLYRYGHLIVSKVKAGGMAQFYISHNDSGPSATYGIKFRSGWNDTYLDTWRTLLDSTNYISYTVKKDGTGATGSWGINITGNAATATTASEILGMRGDPTAATYYYPMMAVGSGSEDGAKSRFIPRVSPGFAFYTKNGTTSTLGTAELGLGNSISSSSAGNMAGAIYLYGTSSGYTYIKPSNNTANSYTLYLPSANGTLMVAGENGTLPINQGGTNAASASQARVNLGICSTTSDIVYNSSNIIASSTEPTTPTEGMIWLKI